MIFQRTELVNLIIRSRRLTCELVAGNVNDLKSLLMKLLIHLLKILIMRCKATASSRIYN